MPNNSANNQVNNNWVDKIRLKWTKGKDDSSTYSIGSTFDNIRYSSKEDSYTLRNFFDTVKTFFNKQMHMIYQQDEPKDLKIMEWYEVTPDGAADDNSDEQKAAKNNNEEHYSN